MSDSRQRNDQPLAGRRVVITRDREQGAELIAALEALGASVVVFPTVRIELPVDRAPLQEAAARVTDYDWVVFTSVNGVRAFLSVLADLDPRPRWTAGKPAVAAVGTTTAASLRVGGIEPILVPDRHTAEALAELLCAQRDMPGALVLLPRGDRARPQLPRRLKACGANVEEVEAYRTVPTRVGSGALRAEIDAGRIDAITFLAPSAVDSFVASVGTELGYAVVAVIGPTTGEAARRRGLPVRVEAMEQTVNGLVRGLVSYFQ